jgi:hypothetical protein
MRSLWREESRHPEVDQPRASAAAAVPAPVRGGLERGSSLRRRALTSSLDNEYEVKEEVVEHVEQRGGGLRRRRDEAERRAFEVTNRLS